MSNGLRGGQPGNTNAAKAKRWRDAIDRALERRCKSEGIAELDRLAEKYLDAVEAMSDGEKPSIAGFSDLRDTLDGKPAQAVTLAGDEEQPLKIVHESR